jgi:hypothetical protein
MAQICFLITILFYIFCSWRSALTSFAGLLGLFHLVFYIAQICVWFWIGPFVGRVPVIRFPPSESNLSIPARKGYCLSSLESVSYVVIVCEASQRRFWKTKHFTGWEQRESGVTLCSCIIQLSSHPFVCGYSNAPVPGRYMAISSGQEMEIAESLLLPLRLIA